MNFKISTLLFAIFSLFLTACSTLIKPVDSLYWRGKDVFEFFERKRLPDTAVQCVKDNELSYVYGYQLALYDLHTYEVGRNATTIFMTTDKIYTGGTTWTYLFADANNKITSVREMSGFGDVEKEFKCGEYAEAVTIASKEDLAKRKTQPRLWSSIYMSSEQNMMWVTDNPSKNLENAKQDAFKQCEKNGGRNCNMIFSFSNMCLAFSQGYKDGKGFDSFGYSIVGSYAEDNALENCTKQGGSSCRLSAPAVCAIPCDILSNNKCMYDQPQVIIPGKNNNQPIDLSINDNGEHWLSK